MPELTVRPLLKTATVSVADVCCKGECKHQSAEECASAIQLVFPYRGVFVRHVGRSQTIADANQLLFFNPGQGYRISHPVEGGDACLSLAIEESLLAELAPRSLLEGSATLRFRESRIRIDPRAQALVALLRHGLHQGTAEPLEAESLALTLARRALGSRSSHVTGGTANRQRIADRTKLVLASDLGRRWTLKEIATEVGGSPVYLTQIFQQIEGIPLYRYQLRLRLARALDLLGSYDDITALGLDLGFSSHSHFSAAFREAYGRSPSMFRQLARRA